MWLLISLHITWVLGNPKERCPALLIPTGVVSLAPEPPRSPRDPRGCPHTHLPASHAGRQGGVEWGVLLGRPVWSWERKEPPPFPVDIWKGQNQEEGKCYSSLLLGTREEEGSPSVLIVSSSLRVLGCWAWGHCRMRGLLAAQHPALEASGASVGWGCSFHPMPAPRS